MIAREGTIQERVLAVLEDYSGLDLSGADRTALFPELGLDSLFLTQVSLAISREFGVQVTFRQLNESLSSIDELCKYLRQSGAPDSANSAPPVEAMAQDASPQPGTSAAQPATPSLILALPPAQSNALGTKAEELIRAQLALMQYQLEVLSRAGAAGATVDARGAAPSAPSMTRVASNDGAGGSSPVDAVLTDREHEAQDASGRGARITGTADNHLRPHQERYLANLVERYVAKTPASKAYTQKYRARLADPRTVSGFNPLYKEIIYPLVVNRSRGARIWDLDGNEYVDHVCGFGPILLGHSHESVVAAVQDQIAKGVETGPQTVLAGEVAELFCELTGHDRCAFASTGSEAVLGAMRLARTVTGRSKMVMFEGAYHGIIDEVILRRGRGGAGLPGAPGIPREALANTLILPWNDLNALGAIRDVADDVAGILLEPVQSRAPDVQPLELLQQLRALCDEIGAALILDEMITGFRMHLGGAQAHFGVKADLATYGKVIGGGYPIGMIAGASRFMDALDGGHWSFGDDSVPTVGVTYFAGTFVRHPAALAAAKAVLLELRERGPALQNELARMTTVLTDELREFLVAISSPIQIKHCSSWFHITAPRDEVHIPLLFSLLRLKGFHVQDGRPLFLTTAHTTEDLQAFATAFREAVSELTLNDFLAGDKLAAHRESKRASARPPVEGARRGLDEHGNPGWYVPHPQEPDQFVKVQRETRT